MVPCLSCRVCRRRPRFPPVHRARALLPADTSREGAGLLPHHRRRMRMKTIARTVTSPGWGLHRPGSASLGPGTGGASRKCSRQRRRSHRARGPCRRACRQQERVSGRRMDGPRAALRPCCTAELPSRARSGPAGGPAGGDPERRRAGGGPSIGNPGLQQHTRRRRSGAAAHLSLSEVPGRACAGASGTPGALCSQTNCAVQSVMATIGGAVMGLLFGAFFGSMETAGGGNAMLGGVTGEFC